MMTLGEVIAAFIRAQRYVRRRLWDEYSVPDTMSAVEWSFAHRKMLALHAERPIAEVFRPHGYGLEFKDAEVHIDFDLCESGRADGFDAWRLFVFCEDNALETECKQHSDFLDALETLGRKGVIEREENLYFLTTPDEMPDNLS